MRSFQFTVVLVGVAVAAGACGADETPAPERTGATTTTEMTVLSTVPAEPERIIPLDGDVAEIVFALGRGDDVVATDLSATYPPEADALPEIGYQRSLSAETIAAYEPTLLIGTDTAGPPEAIADIRRLGVPLVIVPDDAGPAGPGRKIRAVAAALGVEALGERLAASVDAEIEARARVVEPTGLRVVALYIRGSSAQLVLGRDAPTHWLIEAAGGVDIADELDIDEPTPISAEALIAAAPDVLLIPEAGLASVDGIAGLLAIGGLGETPAGQARAVLAYDDQLLLGGGPRTPELLAALIGDLARFVHDPTPTETHP